MSVIRAPNNNGSLLAGGPGNDTLIASYGDDTLSGGAGSDTFTYDVPPWSGSEITDFRPGADRLDLSAILHSDGYGGSDPIGDGRLFLWDDGHGGTIVEIDQDGHGAMADHPDMITDLLGVSPSSLQVGRDILVAWSKPPTAGPPGSGGPGRLITAPHGAAPHMAGTPGDDTLAASDGGGLLTGGPGKDVFRLSEMPWSPVHVTDFTPGTDQLDLTALAPGYHGTSPFWDGYIDFAPDGSGGSYIWVDSDGPGGDWPFIAADLEGTGWNNLQVGRDLLIGAAGGGSTGGGGSGSTGGGTGGSGGGGGTPGRTIVAPDSHGSVLSGGAGDDTLVASTGPDKLIGGDGGDTFVFKALPYNSGHVSDFTPGQDVLDLSAIADAYGYAGSDPVADRWLVFLADGRGDTQVFVNAHDGSHAHIITVLDHVSPASLHAGDWLF